MADDFETRFAPGRKLCGFTVQEILPFPAIGARMAHLRHDATGARMLFIENDDTNRLFDLTFFTEAVDSTGLPHIFEHATLGGSDRYPSKSLFFNLIYQTYNTFMNAMTSDRMTTYPVASLSEAQLLALADVYTDSCLHPRIMEDESIFREEAWRYRLSPEDGPLTLEGTVYSEMKGALSLSSMASYNLYRALYPGSLAANVFGGDPDVIPTLTWQRLREYHDAYYTPSNCLAFLYGKIEDPEAFLRLLDGAFTPLGTHAAVHAREEGRAAPGFTERAVPFPAERGGDTENASCIQYGVACPGLSYEDRLNMDLLASLLSASASPLIQRLQEVLPTGDFDCGWDNATPEGTLVFTCENVNADDAPLFRRTVDEVLRGVAEDGFAPDFVDAMAASVSLSMKLLRESQQVGLSVVQGIAYGYATTGKLTQYLDFIDALDSLPALSGAGVFQALVRRFLLNPESAALVSTYPAPGMKEEKDEALRAALEKKKAALTPEERSALVEASAAEPEADDASALVAKVQAVTARSLPEELRRYEVRESAGLPGMRMMDVPAGVEGVGRIGFFLDAAGIPQPLLHWARLYLDLMPYLDGERHTRAELATLSGRYLYSFSARLSAMGSGADYVPRLRVSWLSQDRDVGAGYGVAEELLRTLRVDDAEKLTGGIRAVRANLRLNVTQAPFPLMQRRAFGYALPEFRYADYLSGLDYFAFLKEAERIAKDAPAQAAALLREARDCFLHLDGAVFSFAGNDESIRRHREHALRFAQNLLPGGMARASYAFPPVPEREGLIIDSAVQYNGIVCDFAALGMPESGALGAVVSLVSDAYLYPMLRDRYGAYGVLHGVTARAGLSVISYRDPNVEKSFEILEGLPGMLASLSMPQEKLDGYILSRYSGLASPVGELAGAGAWIASLMEGTEPDRALRQMRELKALTPAGLADCVPAYRALVERGRRFTAGGAAAVRGCGLYDAVQDPFAGEA